MKRLVKGERVACQEMRMIRWSAITLHAGVMPHGGMKEKETATDRDNERTRGGMKRRCYMCVPCAVYTRMCTYREAVSMCAQSAHERAEKKREGIEKGPKVVRTGRSSHRRVGGQGGPRCKREREGGGEEGDSGEEEFTEGRGRYTGPTGTTARREQRSEEEDRRGGRRILTERWGMSRVVCSHGSSLGTAVQYAGQGKVTFLCVRACARARLLTVLHTIARIHVCTRHYIVALSL